MRAVLFVVFSVFFSFVLLTGCNNPLEPSAGFVLISQEKSWTFSPGEVGISYKKNSQGFLRGYSWEAVIDHNKMNQILVRLSQEIDVLPASATLELGEEGKFTIHPSADGKRVNLHALKELLEEKALTGGSVEIPVKKILPDVSTADLEALLPKGLLSTFATEFTKIEGRTENIRLSSEAVNGMVIAPGETFSFNETVGRREVERGYKPAAVISGGRFSAGLGGGVCQVSSTLYNALLLADIEIVERWPHSIKVPYLPAGRDATVSWDIQDLKFKNNTGGYLVINSSIEGQKLTFSIYGNTDHTAGKRIEVKTEVHQVIEPPMKTVQDPGLPPGKKVVEGGQKGYKTSTYLVITKDGEKEERKLSQDYYRPVAGQVRIGSGQQGSAPLEAKRDHPETSVPEEGAG